MCNHAGLSKKGTTIYQSKTVVFFILFLYRRMCGREGIWKREVFSLEDYLHHFSPFLSGRWTPNSEWLSQILCPPSKMWKINIRLIRGIDLLINIAVFWDKIHTCDSNIVKLRKISIQVWNYGTNTPLDSQSLWRLSRWILLKGVQEQQERKYFKIRIS